MTCIYSTYGIVWTQFLKVHETIGDQRVKFASDIAEVADDVQIMCKDTEKSRKQVKEIGIRHERNRLDAESSLEKVIFARERECVCERKGEPAIDTNVSKKKT